MTERYDSAWWSIAIPENWQVERDDACTTITSGCSGGVLQLSAYQNESASITNQMLTDFALEETKEGVPLTGGRFGDFEGLVTEYRENNIFWRKAWLKNDNVLLYVTYNCPKGDEAVQKDILKDMLSTLKRRSTGL